MIFFLASSVLGKRISRIPFLNDASTLIHLHLGREFGAAAEAAVGSLATAMVFFLCLFLTEFCTPIRAFSPKAAWECRFQTKDDSCQIPSSEGKKPKASGWVFMTDNPPRRCAPPLQGGDFQPANDSRAKFRSSLFVSPLLLKPSFHLILPAGERSDDFLKTGVKPRDSLRDWGHPALFSSFCLIVPRTRSSEERVLSTATLRTMRPFNPVSPACFEPLRVTR